MPVFPLVVNLDRCRVRDRKLLTEALDITPPFLRNKQSDQGESPLHILPRIMADRFPTGAVIDYRNWQIPLGRRFRSLKLFFVLRSFGTSGFISHLRRLDALAAIFESHVLSDSRFSLFVPRSLSLVVFRIKAPTAEEEEAVNKLFFKKVSERTDIHLTPTVVGGQYCTRLAVGSPLTQEMHINKAWEVVLETARDTAKEAGLEW